MVKLYHGTRASAVEGIRAKGLVPPPGTGPGWYMLTDDLEQAKAYAFDGTVIEFDIPEGKIFGPDRDSDFFLWSATPHSAYIGRDANAYAIKTSVPPQYIERVITGSWSIGAAADGRPTSCTSRGRSSGALSGWMRASSASRPASAR
jgi:hypothetical protein